MIGKAFSIAVLTLMALSFGQALMHKLRHPGRFAQSVRDYDLLPGTLANSAAVLLILAELSVLGLILAAFALLDIRDAIIARMGLGAAAFLLALYGAAMGINLARKQFGLDCGCTAGSTPISVVLVLRNFGLVALAVGGILVSDFEIDGLSIGIPSGILLFLVYLTTTQLTSNRLLWTTPRKVR